MRRRRQNKRPVTKRSRLLQKRTAAADAPFFLSRQLRVLRYATEAADFVPNSNRPTMMATCVADEVHFPRRGQMNKIDHDALNS